MTPLLDRKCPSLMADHELACYLVTGNASLLWLTMNLPAIYSKQAIDSKQSLTPPTLNVSHAWHVSGRHM